MENPEDLVERLRKRARIRRQLLTRKSVLLGENDKLSNLLEEAAGEIKRLRVALYTPEYSFTWD